MESTKDDPLVGLRVHVSIDEDGYANPPHLPNGTITEKLTVRGTQHHYFILHLDEPVRYLRPEKARDWLLTDLTIHSRYEGHELNELLTQTHEDVIVNIINHSNGEYFAIGSVVRVFPK